MPPKKRQKTSLASLLALASAPAQSLDQDDPSVLPASSSPSSSSSSDSFARQSPQAVRLCESLLRLLEQLKQLESGRYSDDNNGPDVYEVNIDRVLGSVELRKFRETRPGLKSAAREARERVADLIAKRKQDIAGLEEETTVLNTRMQESGEEETEALLKQLAGIRKMIGMHKAQITELELKKEVEVEVEVERFSTRVEVVKEDTAKVEKEKMLVPMSVAGIYVFGGRDPKHECLSTMERYDAGEDRWNKATSMAFARIGHASAVLGDTIYAIGGYNSVKAEWANSLERFSALSGKWERLDCPVPTERKRSATGVLNGRIYVAGGLTKADAVLSSVSRFDAQAKKWEDVAPMSCARSHSGGAVLAGLFYVLGGTYDNKTAVSTVERYDPRKNEWEGVASMKTTRWRCAAATLNARIYAIGGMDNDCQWLSSVERFDPTTNRWEDVAPLTSARTLACAAVLDGRLYVIGGEDNDVRCMSSVERYDASRNSWERVADMTTAYAGACAAVAL